MAKDEEKAQKRADEAPKKDETQAKAQESEKESADANDTYNLNRKLKEDYAELAKNPPENQKHVAPQVTE